MFLCFFTLQGRVFAPVRGQIDRRGGRDRLRIVGKAKPHLKSMATTARAAKQNHASSSHFHPFSFLFFSSDPTPLF